MRLIGLLAVGALVACSPQAAFPDRETFEFATSDGTSIFTYLCAPGATPADTQARAAQAHNFVETNLNAAANVFADQIITGVEQDAGQLSTSITAATTLNRNAEAIAEQSESRYQCLFIDERDA